MRAYHISPGAGLASLTLREQPIPEPAASQALVRVRASALNYRELLVARDMYPLPLKPDLIPVSDGAGEVVAVGANVTRVQPGDRVMATIFPRWLDGPSAGRRQSHALRDHGSCHRRSPARARD